MMILNTSDQRCDYVQRRIRIVYRFQPHPAKERVHASFDRGASSCTGSQAPAVAPSGSQASIELNVEEV
jgi:hypothetical protein